MQEGLLRRMKGRWDYKWGLDKGAGLQLALGSSDWCKQQERTSIVHVLLQKLLEQMLVNDYAVVIIGTLKRAVVV